MCDSLPLSVSVSFVLSLSIFFQKENCWAFRTIFFTPPNYSVHIIILFCFTFLILFQNKEYLRMMMMFIDFEKVFDSIEWAFIERALNYFNFGPSLVNWFRLFYNQVSSAIQNNGWVSESFSLGRGVRQGCPMSPYLFIISAEILANLIRRDKDVKGFMTGEVEHKLSQLIC